MAPKLKSELARFSAALGELYAPGGVEQFSDRLFAAMRVLIPADLFFYNEFGPEGGVGGREDPGCFTPALMEGFVSNLDEHLSLQHAFRTGTKKTIMLSDFYSQRQFRQTGLYRDFFGQLGIDQQLGGLFDGRKMKMGYAFNRGGRAFSADERALVELFAEHLPQARRNAELWSIARERNGDASTIVMVEPADDGRPSIISPAAAELFQAYFGPSRYLPEAVARWMKAQRARSWYSTDQPEPSRTLLAQGIRGTLTVYYLPPDAGGREYLLAVEKPNRSPAHLRRLGLTPRQAEILFWISEGKRNKEIAIILASSARTVEKHVERILESLGVETRSAAAAMAREALAQN